MPSLWGRAVDGRAIGELVVRRRPPSPGAVVLAYHDITDDPACFTDYAVSPRRFRAHLRLARRWGYRFVDLATIVHRFSTARDLDGLAAVVFDDCLVGAYRNALPILADLGVPATLFPVTGVLGTAPGWWPGSARTMTGPELAAMVDAGCRLGSHTRHHPSLPGLARQRLSEEVGGSRAELEDRLGTGIDLFAYPFGHHDERVRDAVDAAGYRAAFSFLNRRVVAGLDHLRLPRLNMHEGLGAAHLAHYLARPSHRWPDTQAGAVGPGSVVPPGPVASGDDSAQAGDDGRR